VLPFGNDEKPYNSLWSLSNLSAFGYHQDDTVKALSVIGSPAARFQCIWPNLHRRPYHVGIGAAFLETSDETPYHSVGRKPSSSMFLIVEASSFGTTEAARSFVVRGGMLFLRIGCVMTNVTTLLVNDSCLVVLVLVLSTRPERNSMFARESRFSSPTSQEHSISRRHNPLVASITEWILGPPPWCVRVSRVERYGR